MKFVKEEWLSCKLNRLLRKTRHNNRLWHRLKLTKPEMVNQIDLQLIQSAQAGSLRGKVTDDQLKVLLRQIAGQKREIKITRK